MRTSPLKQVLYFFLGFAIAFVLVLLIGCSDATSSSGLDRAEETEITPIICDPETNCFDETLCCAAMIPSCWACRDECSVEVWLEKICGPDAVDAEYAGWNAVLNEPKWICKVEIVN